MHDASPYALRPPEPSTLLEAMRISGVINKLSFAESTRRGQAPHWRSWVAHCEGKYRTPALRAAWDPSSGTPHAVWLRRETHLQEDFVAITHFSMKPRSRLDPMARPESAMRYIQSVRREHEAQHAVLPLIPALGRFLIGLKRSYVLLNGPESLQPRRKAPLTNQLTTAILSVPNGTALQRRCPTVNWDSPLFTAFRAMLTTTRQAGARKADLIPPKAEQFHSKELADLMDMVPTLLASAGRSERTSSGGGLPTRSNIAWSIGGRHLTDPDPIALRHLAKGDYAIYQPGGTKTDHDATTFDNPVYLPFEDSPLNAASAIASMELGLPIRGARRRQTPLFAIDRAGTSLDQVLADDIFKQLATLALGASTASTLSLHSGRVWLANAMHAIKAPPTTIQRYVRWRSIDSVLTYLRISPEEYTATILRASAADISHVDAEQLPKFDWLDDRFGDIADADAQENADAEDNDVPTAPNAEPQPAPKRKGPAPRDNAQGGIPRAPNKSAALTTLPDDPPPALKRKGPALRHPASTKAPRATTATTAVDDATTCQPPAAPIHTSNNADERPAADVWGTSQMTPIPASLLADDVPNASATRPGVPAATIMYDNSGVEQWYHCTITKNNTKWLQIRLQSGKRASVTREKLRIIK